MKKLIYSTCCGAFLLLACGGKSSSNGFISGTLENTKARYVYLEELLPTGTRMIDSAEIKEDGRFMIKKTAGARSYYRLRIGQNMPNNYMIPVNNIVLITDSSETIKVKAKGPNFSTDYTVEGSLETNLFLDVIRYAEESQRRLDSLSPQMMMQLGISLHDASIRQGNIMEERRKFVEEFIEKHQGRFVILQSITLLNMESNFDVINKISKDLEKTYPQNPWVENFRRQVAEVEPFVVGAVAPDFTITTPEGKPISLKDFRGKYVLVDFWASWCKPCRMANPALVKLYEKYKGRGLEIFGVSLDAQQDQWVNAIRADGLTWKHGSDLKYWSSSPAKLYKVSGIPYSVLLDAEGKIVAKNLHADQLDQALDQLLPK